MIKLSMVAVPPTDERLAAIAQIGVDHLVHYDMSNGPGKYDALGAFVRRAREFGLRVPVVESGPPIDRIVLGQEGWEVQTQEWIHPSRIVPKGPYVSWLEPHGRDRLSA